MKMTIQTFRSYSESNLKKKKKKSTTKNKTKNTSNNLKYFVEAYSRNGLPSPGVWETGFNRQRNPKLTASFFFFCSISFLLNIKISCNRIF